MVDFGRDWSCATDLDPSGRMVSGFTLLAQALVRRLITPRGGLVFHPDYGAGILDMIDSVGDDRSASRVAAIMDSQFVRDQRVRRSTTTATYANGIVTATSTIYTSQGPFTLVTSLTSATIQILKVAA